MEEGEDKIRVEIWLDLDDFALLEIASKHYGVSDTGRSVSDMASIIVRNALKRIAQGIQLL
jgi:hypothetical protein